MEENLKFWQAIAVMGSSLTLIIGFIGGIFRYIDKKKEKAINDKISNVKIENTLIIQGIENSIKKMSEKMDDSIKKMSEKMDDSLIGIKNEVEHTKKNTEKLEVQLKELGDKIHDTNIKVAKVETKVNM